MDFNQIQQERENLLKQQEEIQKKLAELVISTAVAKQKAIDDFREAIQLYKIDRKEIKQLMMETGIHINTYAPKAEKKFSTKGVVPSSVNVLENNKRKEIAERLDRLLLAGHKDQLLNDFESLGEEKEQVFRHVDPKTEAFLLENFKDSI